MPLWEDAAVQAHTLRTHAGLALDLVSLDLQPTWAPYVEVSPAAIVCCHWWRSLEKENKPDFSSQDTDVLAGSLPCACPFLHTQYTP